MGMLSLASDYIFDVKPCIEPCLENTWVKLSYWTHQRWRQWSVNYCLYQDREAKLIVMNDIEAKWTSCWWQRQSWLVIRGQRGSVSRLFGVGGTDQTDLWCDIEMKRKDDSRTDRIDRLEIVGQLLLHALWMSMREGDLRAGSDWTSLTG